MVNALTDRLAVGGTWIFHPSGVMSTGSGAELTLGDGLFAVTPPDTNTVDEVALFSFVAETTGFVGARRTGGTMDNVQLAVLPAPVDR